MKTRFAIFTLLLLASVSLFAQTHVEQKGYVRSIGRPDNKYGERLEGATIRVNGQHNDVRSDANGDFTIAFDDATVGVTSYSLSRVRLAGYEVNEKEVIGRQFPVSAEVPHEIVMVSLAEKQTIEDSLVARIDRRYHAKLAQLEREKEQLGEEYHTQLQKLFDEYEKREQLISDMVERYANTDYAKLDSTAAKINAYIESGELEKADSIIQTMNVSKLESEYKAIRDDNDRLRVELQKGEKAEDNLYQNLYTAYNGKYEIFAQQFENDSAAFYLEKIVELDTTNVENLLRAGDYIRDYLADYDKAIELYDKSFKYAQKYGENNYWLANVYLSLGTIYNDKAEYLKSLENHKKALDMFTLLYGSEDLNVAYSMGNVGSAYHKIGNYSESLKWFENAQESLISLDVTDDYEYSNLLSNIGKVYDDMSDYVKAMEYYQKSLNIGLKHGEKDDAVAVSYNCIGGLYYEMGDYQKSLEYLNKSLDIRLQIFDVNHPNVARCYENIGVVYYEMGNYENAIECFRKSLDIKLSIYGEYHDDVAMCYNNIGNYYVHVEDFLNALKYFEKSLEIKRAVYGDNHSAIAVAYNNLGYVYDELQDYYKASDCYQNALKINISLFGENNSGVAICYNNIGLLYNRINNKNNALKYFLKAYKINVNLFGENHNVVASNCNNIGLLYGKLEDYEKSLLYLGKALDICKNSLGEKHRNTAAVYYNFGKVYDAMENYEDALKYHKQALDIYVLGEENSLVEQCYYHIGRIYYKMGNYIDALEYFQKDKNLCSSLYGVNHVYTIESYSNIYKTLYNLVATEPAYSDTLTDFLSTKLFVAQFPVDSTSKSELQGEFYLLQLGDWNMESIENVFDTNKSLNGKKRNVVLYKDGKIINRKLDKKTTFDLILKEVGKEEHDKIITK